MKNHRRPTPQPPCSEARYRALIAAAARDALRFVHEQSHGDDLRAAAAFRPVLAYARLQMRGPGAARARGRATLAELDAGVAPRPSDSLETGEIS